MLKTENRYLIISFHGASLEGNPINSPVDRDLHIYLPLKYHEDSKKRYPVIYCIHGYTGNTNNQNIYIKWNANPNLSFDQIPKELLKMVDTDKLASYERFDELISKQNWKPFILVQPDASLYLPHYLGLKELTGAVKTKGSFYINSPYTGKYLDYIVKDVIEYMDTNYRTIPEKNGRAIMGTSMGGYGTLYITLHHPEYFSSAVALAPANLNLDSLEWEMVSPFNALLFGEDKAKEMGFQSLHDIHEACDLIFSKEDPLLPSIQKDKNGRIIKMDEKAAENWKKYDIKNVIKEHPDALKSIHLLMYCHKKDQYGLAEETRKIHDTLQTLNIKHDVKIYTDALSNLDPHTFGNGFKILNAVKYCIDHFS